MSLEHSKFKRLDVDDHLTVSERAALRERHAALRDRLKARNDDWSEAVEAYAVEHGYDPTGGQGFASAALEFEETEAGQQFERRKQEILDEKAALYRSLLEERFGDPDDVTKLHQIGVIYRAFGTRAHSTAIAAATGASESYIDQFRAIDTVTELPEGRTVLKFDHEAHDAGEPAVALQYDPDQQRETVSQSMRDRILEQDGEQCRRCGSGTDLEIHHIRPVSHGGEDTPDNLATLCVDCHQDAHEMATDGGIVPAYPLDRFEDWLDGDLDICGAPTTAGTPCQNQPDACPHHDQ